MKSDNELLDLQMRIRKEILPVMYKQIDIDNALEAKKNFFNKKKINAELADFYTQFVNTIQTQVWPSIYSSNEEYRLAMSNIGLLENGKSSIPNITELGRALEQICYSLFCALSYKKRYYTGGTNDRAHTEELYDHYNNRALDLLDAILNTYYRK